MAPAERERPAAKHRPAAADWTSAAGGHETHVEKECQEEHVEKEEDREGVAPARPGSIGSEGDQLARGSNPSRAV